MTSIPFDADAFAQRIDARFFGIVQAFGEIKSELRAYENTLEGKPTMIIRRRVEQLRQQTMGLAVRMENLHRRNKKEAA
ncbi:MAG TPA: hypothetical protein VGY56_10535 [Verrucomicrobiae bacterium]|nr:hypothetical protein [Verrucomicrobiae bacterium]